MARPWFWEPILEVGSVSAPQGDAAVILAGQQPEAIVLDFVNPLGPAGGFATRLG